MKLFLKIIGILVLIVVLVIAGGLVYLFTALPKASPVKDIRVEITPERIERGEYLARHVAVCIDCHSTRDWQYYSGPVTPNTDGQGGMEFGPDLGFPGHVYAANITPAAIASWSDGELIRAITEGVSKDKTALFPLMPYHKYGRMSENDLYSIVAYIRSLRPIPNGVPKTKLDFPMNLIVRLIPQPSNLQPMPDTTDTVAYGKYLTTMAFCSDCHTPFDKGKPVVGMEFAGGMEFTMPGVTIRSANITPDEETGLGRFSRETFIERFKAFTAEEVRRMKVPPTGAANTPMPWTMYNGMTEYDLGAIYDYLQTIKPVKNSIEIFSAGQAKTNP